MFTSALCVCRESVSIILYFIKFIKFIKSSLPAGANDSDLISPNSVIITPTESGYSARKVSRFKPNVPILAMTRDMTTLRQLNLSWGVRPFMVLKKYKNLDDMMYDIVKFSDKNKLLKGYKKELLRLDMLLLKDILIS